MEIKEIMQLLDNEIASKMAEFLALVHTAREMNRIHEEEMNAHYRKMAHFFEELKPAEKIIREKYPKMNNLFDQLKMRKDNNGNK